MSTFLISVLVVLTIASSSDASFDDGGFVGGFHGLGVVGPAMEAPAFPYETHGYHHPSETRNLVGAYTRENEMLTDVSLSLPARARKLAAAKRAARKRMNLRKKNLLKKTLHKKKRN